MPGVIAPDRCGAYRRPINQLPHASVSAQACGGSWWYRDMNRSLPRAYSWAACPVQRDAAHPLSSIPALKDHPIAERSVDQVAQPTTCDYQDPELYDVGEVGESGASLVHQIETDDHCDGVERRVRTIMQFSLTTAAYASAPRNAVVAMRAN